MSAPYPNINRLHRLQELLTAAFAGKLLENAIVHGELAVRVTLTDLLEVLTWLRDTPDAAFSQLMDLCGVDYPARPDRFEVVYNLLSLRHNLRIRVKASVAENVAVPSATGIYPAAGWCERETWDLVGIPFNGNPDLRRILTDYDFEGHPLRKDFPLTGHLEVRYDAEKRKVVYEPVKLVQDFRSFDTLSPWEGAQYILPGDEKAAS
ncbi:MAG: NADH-quinone oxidoreductase subunit C [Holosporales bacterium]|jgi:NADH-quinone oxidoreductase subunit C